MARLLESSWLLVIALCCVLRYASTETNILDRFLTFIEDFERPYKNGSHEFERRFENFKINLQQIEHMNKPYGSKMSGVFGITKFSDLSQEEFSALYLDDLRPDWRIRDSSLRFQSEKPSRLQQALSMPQKIDWRDYGVVSPVKNQGTCGACWAFAATELVESSYSVQYNSTVPQLAVQQLIDCSTQNKGCQGGDICLALGYIQTKGITYDKYYPLTDKDGVCKSVPTQDPIIKIDKYTCTRYVGAEEQILSLLGSVGPVSAAVDASTWHNYVGGIIQFHCENKINHAVDIVGYDLTGPVPYYIVRNSWGTDFGMDGYMYIKIGSNLCGIAEEVSGVTVS